MAVSLVLWDHEFQSGPDIVDGADLDVDEAKRKRRVAHDNFRQVADDARGLLRPRYPDHAILRDGSAVAAQFISEPPSLRREHMHHVERRFRAGRDLHTRRQWADDVAIGG